MPESKKRKKKRRPGRVAHSNNSVLQDPRQAVYDKYPKLAEYARRSQETDAWSAENLRFFHAPARVALTSRGWTAEEPDASIGDGWSWRPSAIEDDDITESYYEVTSIFPREYGFAVDLAGPAHGPWSGARYLTLEELLTDIDAIESFRYGNRFPALPHAHEIAEGLPFSLSLRRED